MFWIFDWTIILMIPAMLLAFYAQAKVSSNLGKYSKVATGRGLTGLQVAQQLLHENGIRDVEIERLPENQKWADHYDPKAKKIRLSAHVHDTASVSAVAVAAHEVGHAIQHNSGYVPLNLRSAILPVANFGSKAAFPLMLLGFLLGEGGLFFINLGIIFFSASILFQIVTLPVEFNASRRAIAALRDGMYLDEEEVRPARKVLNAAAMTYVAAAFMALMQLPRMILISGRRR